MAELEALDGAAAGAMHRRLRPGCTERLPESRRPLYVTIEASSEELVLAAARALEPMPR